MLRVLKTIEACNRWYKQPQPVWAFFTPSMASPTNSVALWLPPLFPFAMVKRGNVRLLCRFACCTFPVRRKRAGLHDRRERRWECHLPRRLRREGGAECPVHVLQRWEHGVSRTPNRRLRSPSISAVELVQDSDAIK